jgi:hypothetical protein
MENPGQDDYDVLASEVAGRIKKGDRRAEGCAPGRGRSPPGSTRPHANARLRADARGRDEFDFAECPTFKGNPDHICSQ